MVAMRSPTCCFLALGKVRAGTVGELFWPLPGPAQTARSPDVRPRPRFARSAAALNRSACWRGRPCRRNRSSPPGSAAAGHRRPLSSTPRPPLLRGVGLRPLPSGHHARQHIAARLSIISRIAASLRTDRIANDVVSNGEPGHRSARMPLRYLTDNRRTRATLIHSAPQVATRTVAPATTADRHPFGSRHPTEALALSPPVRVGIRSSVQAGTPRLDHDMWFLGHTPDQFEPAETGLPVRAATRIRFERRGAAASRSVTTLPQKTLHLLLSPLSRTIFASSVLDEIGHYAAIWATPGRDGC